MSGGGEGIYNHQRPKSPWWVWLLPLPLVWWAAVAMACRWQPGQNLAGLLAALTDALNDPFLIGWSSSAPRFLFLFSLAYAVTVLVVTADQKNYRRGEEHGSARWGNVYDMAKRYRDKQNLILTRHFCIGLDGRKHRRNLNVLVIGGTGAGKSRSHALPNILQGCCSYVITDPKGELLRKTGHFLEKAGYEVRVFDLLNPDSSFGYNPFAYVHDDKDVLRLINNLIRNTTPKGANGADPFWEKSETALLQALMLYLLHEAPPEEQNFSMVMEMLGAAEVHEDDDSYQSPLDVLFDRLEERKPDSIAVKQYRIYKQAAGAVCFRRLLNQSIRKSPKTYNLT